MERMDHDLSFEELVILRRIAMKQAEIELEKLKVHNPKVLCYS